MDLRNPLPTENSLSERLTKPQREILAVTAENIRRWLTPANHWVILEAAPSGKAPLTLPMLTEAIRKTAAERSDSQGIAVLSANRLGLKYLAGAASVSGRKEHASADPVPGTDAARASGCGSFTKGELLHAFAGAGIDPSGVRWYYPYPDSELTTDIFSDAWLPDTGTFSENAWDIHATPDGRWQLFDEAAVGRTVAAEGLFPELANAFLAIVPARISESPQAERPIYVRFSQQRDFRYRIQTAIYEDTVGHRRVEKTPLTEEAAGHLAQMHERSIALGAQYGEKGHAQADGDARAQRDAHTELQQGELTADLNGKIGGARGISRIHINHSHWNPPALELEYADGRNLEGMLESLLIQGDEEAFCRETGRYFTALTCGEIPGARTPFAPTAETLELLGPEMVHAEQEETLSVTNLDPVFSNVLVQEDGSYLLLDCEWTCTCPVPVSFLTYRCLFRFFHCRPEHAELWARLEKDCGITPEKRQIYQSAEAAFQQRVRGDGATIADAMTAAGNVGLPLADAMHYLAWEQSLYAPSSFLIDENQKKLPLDFYTAQDAGGETESRETVGADRGTSGKGLHLTMELPSGLSATGRVRFCPCLLPGTLTVYALMDERGRPLEAAAPQAATTSKTGFRESTNIGCETEAGSAGYREFASATQYHFLTSDPALEIEPFPESRQIRISYMYDAVLPVAPPQRLPLAGLRRNAAADNIRRNELLSELVSLRPLKELSAAQQETISRLTAQNAQMTAELAAMRDSLSWRVTGPLRSTMGAVRRLTKKGMPDTEPAVEGELPAAFAAGEKLPAESTVVEDTPANFPAEENPASEPAEKGLSGMDAADGKTQGRSAHTEELPF